MLAPERASHRIAQHRAGLALRQLLVRGGGVDDVGHRDDGDADGAVAEEVAVVVVDLNFERPTQGALLVCVDGDDERFVPHGV